MTAGLVRARWLALIVPAVLLAGAWGFQLIGGLVPCEMCHWQRWPYYAALVVALLAFAAPPRPARVSVLLAALLIAASGVIGVLHAGVEYHWWPGFTSCTSTLDLSGMDATARLDAILHAPLVRCDAAQWTLAGVSLAGFNAIASLASTAAIGWLVVRK